MYTSVSDLDTFAAAVYARTHESNIRDPRPIYSTSPPQHKPSPPRDKPTPEYMTIDHPSVVDLVHRLDVFVSMKGQDISRIPCTETAFALTALVVFDRPADHLHALFWSPTRRVDTAHRVQRVIESAQYLAIPVPWKSAAHALITLATQDKALAAPLNPKAQAGGGKAVQSAQSPSRLTRAAAARLRANEVRAPTPAASPPSERKRRRTPPPEAPAPQRGSARQQKLRAEAAETIPPAVVASTMAVFPKRARSRSASQESNETLVASSSSSTPSSFSRAASVSSADTVVEVVSDDNSKGKGRLIAPATTDKDGDVPMDTESVAGTGMLTRSRTKTAPEIKPARTTPYPPSKNAQIAAGRGKSKAPTGKRKVAKAKAKAQ
ncbi:hypothetical protein B0H19DRAFT_1093413 [Mycena capillaripes]|nr:hypothetical protein B0H19DRAFT_1093413 [Mycena capillaripes]